jgi:hypothetical protein
VRAPVDGLSRDERRAHSRSGRPHRRDLSGRRGARAPRPTPATQVAGRYSVSR